MDRKGFIKSSIILTAGTALYGCKPKVEQPGSPENWDPGDVAHILPTVNDNRILVACSFRRPIDQAFMKVGSRKIPGERRDTFGLFWGFDVENLEPDTTYNLELWETNKRLCDPWPLKTFPASGSTGDHMRLMVYTCPGGHPDSIKFFPLPEDQKESAESYATRRIQLLKRGLSQNPDAIIVIGDSVYWDLSGNGKNKKGMMTQKRVWKLAPPFDKSKPVLGTENEEILQTVVTAQLADLYGTACRSTPMFFFNDDHDYFENDEANDVLITFPPKPFQLELARTVQHLYTPPFLPDINRPGNLPGSGAADRARGVSESFGTLRYGRLAEFLLYDCRRFLSLDGLQGQFIPRETEQWLHHRTAAKDVKHTIHVPSTPFGWSAGKWGEWYPDLLGPDGKLHDNLNKPYWQSGWKAQHDRILQNMYAAKHKKPIMVSGDLHALASGRIYQNEEEDFSDNPIHCILSGPLGNNVFPSTFRKVKASSPGSIGMEEDFENYEENGFSILDIDESAVNVQLFKFLWSRDQLAAIPNLDPFSTIKI